MTSEQRTNVRSDIVSGPTFGPRSNYRIPERFGDSKMRTEIGPGGHLRVRTEQGPVIWFPEEDIREFHDQPPVIFTYLSIFINT